MPSGVMRHKKNRDGVSGNLDDLIDAVAAWLGKFIVGRSCRAP